MLKLVHDGSDSDANGVTALDLRFWMKSSATARQMLAAAL